MADEARMSVYISHDLADDAFCYELAEGLRRAGADVSFNEGEIEREQDPSKREYLAMFAHQTYRGQVAARPVFIVVLSEAAFASGRVRDECEKALECANHDPARILLPVLAGAVREENIPPSLRGFRRIEASSYQPYPQAEAIARTLSALHLTLPGEPALQVIPQASESAEELVMSGNALEAQGQHARALQFFQRAAQLDPSSFAAWANISMVATRLGSPDVGLDACERALALDDQRGGIWLNKGQALADLKRPEEALAAIERALTLDERNPATWQAKVATLRSLGRDAEAEEAFSEMMYNLQMQ